MLIPLQVEMQKAPRRNARMTAIHHGDDKFTHLPLGVSHIAEKFTKQPHVAPPFCECHSTNIKVGLWHEVF